MSSIDDAVNAALKGPEKKFLDVRKHDFHVKPAKIARSGENITVSGQISHALKFRPDDQVHYKITKAKGVVKDVDINIDRGGVLGPLAKALSGAALYMGVPVPSDKVEGVLREIGEKVTGEWEGAAEFIVANIALKAK